MAIQAQLLQQLTQGTNTQNTELEQLRALQNMNIGGQQNSGIRKLDDGLIKGMGGAALAGAVGGTLLTRHQQDQDIKKLKRKVSQMVTENIMRKRRYDSQLTSLGGKINNLEDTLGDLGESLSSMLSDLDVWTQGHVNMLAT